MAVTLHGKVNLDDTGVTALWGYLYLLLTNEDYALLIGSIGLFLGLALVMLITRRIDWYAVGRPT